MSYFLCIAAASIITFASTFVAGVQAPDRAAVLDTARDARLAQPVRLAARGALLADVLRELGGCVGVSLDAEAVLARERLIAHVPHAAAAEVMERVAGLYRARWELRGKGSPPRYRLVKPRELAREEDALRSRVAELALSRLTDQLRSRTGPAPSLPERTRILRGALRDVVRRLDARHWAKLVRTGFVSIPAATFPGAERGALEEILRPAVDISRENTVSIRQLVPELRQQHPDPTDAFPEWWTLSLAWSSLELERLWISVEVSWGTHLLDALQAEVPEADHAGVALYADRRRVPRPGGTRRGTRRPVNPSTPEGGPAPGAALTDTWRLASAVSARVVPRKHLDSWSTALFRVGEAGGSSVYADYYAPAPSREREVDAALEVPTATPVSQAMDRLCRLQPDAECFWWSQGRAIMIRRRRWLWESQASLPDGLLRQLALAPPGGRPVNAGLLTQLAGLTRFQKEGILRTGRRELAGELWNRLVVFGSMLGPAARERLLGEGLRGSDLSPRELQLLQAVFPGPPGSTRAYSCSVRITPSGDTALLKLDDRWPGTWSGATLFVQLPDQGRDILAVTRSEGPAPD